MRTVDDHPAQVYGGAVDYQGIITIEPGKRGGKPVIRGLRITVDDVLSYLAAGMTVEQTRLAILRKASTRLQDPVATVILKEFQKPYFVVAGEVATPGKIEMRERVTALQAIMLAGGLKEGAKASQIVVFRKLNSDLAEVKVLNLKSIRRTSDLENDLTLQPGDMVFVPRDKITKIERFMRLASVAAFIAPKL